MSPRPLLLTSIAALASIVCVAPFFLTGALAVQLTEDLGFGPVGLGTVVAIFHASAGITAVRLGRLVDQLGSVATLRIAVAITVLALLGTAAHARSWVTLAGWLAVAGVAFALAQPAANRLLVMGVRHSRLGIAFGIKQSAAPVATMAAGLSVPLLALRAGWRWSYASGAALGVLILVVALLLPRQGRAPRERDSPPEPALRADGTTRRLAVSFGLSVGSASAVTTFFVDAGVRASLTPQWAGTMLAVASCVAIAVRLVSGLLSDWLADGHLRLCGAGLAVGSIGIGMLATGDPVLATWGVVIALAGTWGFNGVFWYALMRASPGTPGAMTGLVTPGGVLGAMAVPAAFGFLAQGASYTAAWVFAGVVAALGAGAMFGSAKALEEVSE